MPLWYNKDKRLKPHKIKGLAICLVIFQFFFQPEIYKIFVFNNGNVKLKTKVIPCKRRSKFNKISTENALF